MGQMRSKGNKQPFWKDIQNNLKASLNILLQVLQRIEVKTEFDDSIDEKDVLKSLEKAEKAYNYANLRKSLNNKKIQNVEARRASAHTKNLRNDFQCR